VGDSSWTNAQGKLLRMRCVRQLKCVAEGWPSRGKAGNTAGRRRIGPQLVHGGIERWAGGTQRAGLRCAVRALSGRWLLRG
jgi:hypothetical protein